MSFLTEEYMLDLGNGVKVYRSTLESAKGAMLEPEYRKYNIGTVCSRVRFIDGMATGWVEVMEIRRHRDECEEFMKLGKVVKE